MSQNEALYLPIVGMVVTISPSLSLYKMVVLPAASNPTISILISFLPKRFLKRLAMLPILSDISNTNDEMIRKAGNF